MAIQTTDFSPAWWLPGPHAQTLWASLCRRAPNVALRRERLQTPDGDFLDLDFTAGTSGPLVLIQHGLEGSSRSNYARGLLAAVNARGWRGAVLHFRGCSGEPNRSAHAYCAGVTDDLAYVVTFLKQSEPATPLAIVGYSLGGSVLLKWLAEQQSGAVAAAVAVSVPFLLAATAQRVKQGLSNIYNWHLVRAMRNSYRHKFQARTDPPFSLSRLRELNDFYSFDDAITAPLHGYAGADDYYAHASCRQYLHTIQIPTLILHALDDPFTTPDIVPEPHELGPNVKLELSQYGGHVGFVEGAWPWRARYWLEQRIPEYLASYLEASEKT